MSHDDTFDMGLFHSSLNVLDVSWEWRAGTAAPYQQAESEDCNPQTLAMCGKHSAQGAQHRIRIPSARRQRVRPRARKHSGRSPKKLGQRGLARCPRTFLTSPCVCDSDLPAMETIQMRALRAATTAAETHRARKGD